MEAIEEFKVGDTVLHDAPWLGKRNNKGFVFLTFINRVFVDGEKEEQKHFMMTGSEKSLREKAYSGDAGYILEDVYLARMLLTERC
jgi:hypothetical protein